MSKQQSSKPKALDLKQLIHEKYPTLPESQRKVADFLLQHLNDVPFLSVGDVEERTGTSKATVVRLGQSLGFSGFQEIRTRLKDQMQSAIQATERFPLIHKSEGDEALFMVARQDVKNINQTINHIDINTFHEVAELILKADCVYTVGLGISSLMAQVLAYSLNQAAVKAMAFVHDYATFMEQLPFVKSSDVLIAFSFPPYSKETVDAAKAAARKKIPVIAITDKATSPITFHSVKVLSIRSHNMLFTNSFSAISVIINALTTEVAVRNKDKALMFLKEIDTLLTESGHYAVE